MVGYYGPIFMKGCFFILQIVMALAVVGTSWCSLTLIMKPFDGLNDPKELDTSSDCNSLKLCFYTSLWV